MSTTSFRWAAGMVLTMAAASMAAGIGCSVGDQVCTSDSVASDRDDDCPYGPPGGPAVRTGATDECKDIELSQADCAGATWEAVFEAFIDPTQGRCSEGPACHDNGAGNGIKNIYMPKSDPMATYVNLAAVKNGLGQPYIEKNNPEAWILCNLNGSPGAEDIMPIGQGLQKENVNAYNLVARWAVCGMPGPGEGVATTSSSTTAGIGGGGGVGGVGGVGGAGGVGGVGGVGGANGM